MATFNAIKKTLKEKKHKNSTLLTNSFQAKNVISLIDFNKLVLVQKSGLNYGHKSNFNALFDAVLKYLSLEPSQMVKVDDRSSKINGLLLANKDVVELDFFVKLRKLQPTENISKIVARYIHSVNIAQFNGWNLGDIYNHEQEQKEAEAKKLEKALEIVNKAKQQNKIKTATSDVLNA